jgi:hypothetical protein
MEGGPSCPPTWRCRNRQERCWRARPRHNVPHPRTCWPPPEGRGAAACRAFQTEGRGQSTEIPPPPRLPTRVSAHSPACALPSQACPLVPCPAQLLSQVPETKGSVTTPAARASPGHRPRARLNYCWLLTNLAQRSPVHALDSLLHQRAAAPPAARCRVGTPRSCRRARLPAACHLCPCPYLALPRISRIRGGSQHAVGERMPRDLSSGPHL